MLMDMGYTTFQEQRSINVLGINTVLEPKPGYEPGSNSKPVHHTVSLESDFIKITP